MEWNSFKLKVRHDHLKGGNCRSRLWFYLDAETREQCEGVEKAIKMALLGPIPVKPTMEMDTPPKQEKAPSIGFMARGD